MPIRISDASPIRLSDSAISPSMGRQSTARGEFYASPFATNLRALIKYQAAGSVNAWATRIGENQTTINRIANGEMNPSLARATTIAELAGYAAWQLMRPDFDPRTMPPMLDERAMRVAAIFASIPDDRDKDRAESIMEQFAPDGPV